MRTQRPTVAAPCARDALVRPELRHSRAAADVRSLRAHGRQRARDGRVGHAELRAERARLRLRLHTLRELREETGYVPTAGGGVHDLGFCHPNAAFMGNRMTTFFVPRAERRFALDLDEHEEIEVVKVPLAELDDVVEAGLFTNAAVLVAFYRWRRHEADT